MCCIQHQSKMSAVHWSQHILELKTLRKHLNKQKLKLMTIDHRILTVNGGFHIFISLSSSQSPPRGQVSSIDRNCMAWEMAGEVATFFWNIKPTHQVWYFRVYLRKSQSWWADHSVLTQHVSDRGPWQWKIFQNTFSRWMLSCYSLECQTIYLKRGCMQLIISQECEVREKGVGMQ